MRLTAHCSGHSKLFQLRSHLEHMHSVSQTKANEILHLGTWIKQPRKGKNSVLVPTLLCIHVLFSRNNNGNNGWPLGPLPYFLFTRWVWAKSTHLVPWIFKMDRKKNDFYTYFSVCVVCVFANENKDVISKDFFKIFSININGKRRRFDRRSVIVNWKGEKKDWSILCKRKGENNKSPDMEKVYMQKEREEKSYSKHVSFD